MKQIIILFICGICFNSCNGIRSSSKLQQSDTIGILKLVLGSKKIIEDIPETVDSIFIIKNKNVVSLTLLPNKVGKLKIGYIKETPNSTRSLNRTEKISDKPLRYLITSLSIINDSAKVTVHGINQKIDYRFKLVNKNKEWIISNVHWGIE